jgi:general secretion pathway protein M
MRFNPFVSYWSGLQKRERYIFGGGLIGLFLLLSINFAILPFFEARSKITRSIQRQEKVLKELNALNAQYRSLKGGSESLRRVIAGRNPDFKIASHLDGILNETDTKSCIQDFQSSKLPAAEGYNLIRTEIKLGRVKMDQLIKFLYLVESPEYGIRIEQVSIAKTPAETEYLNASLTLKTYEKK